jgi:hypothetical protein
MVALSAPWASVLTDQSGVLTSGQADRLFGRGVVRANMRALRWQRPHRGIVVLHNGPLTTTQQTWLALLTAQHGSALAGVSALLEDQLRGFDRDLVQIVLPKGARRPPLPWVSYHWSTQLGDADVHPLRQPRRTRPARSAIDEASWSIHERRARVIILATAQQRIVAPRDLSDALARRGSPRNRAMILESVHDAAGGIQSLPETDFERIRRRCRLPAPSRQVVLQRRDGKLYLDVEWRRYAARCEIYGIPHSFVAQWDGDVDRANEITLDGPRLLIFTSYAVRRRRQERVGDQLVRLLRRGGWAGG